MSYGSMVDSVVSYGSWASKETTVACMYCGGMVDSMGSMVDSVGYCGGMVNGMS